MHLGKLKRRSLLKTGSALGGVAAFEAFISGAQGQSSAQTSSPDRRTLKDIPLSPTAKLTLERRGQIVLLGVNRPYIQNRIDPDTFENLAKALYDYEHDPTLRAAVLFGHGPHFSRGIDVDAFAARVREGKPSVPGDTATIDPLARSGPHLSKPLILVAHGDTWNMAHELLLAADIRVASEDTNFGQDENTHGRFPGGGATVRFVGEVGWGNAMRYMLTGDHWSAQEAYRMGEIQMVAATPEKALNAGIKIATSVAACAPLGIKATLNSAHLAPDQTERLALSKLSEQYVALYRTEDFLEGRRAEAEGRPPVYRGR
jgi:enoyl-CoA hydratase/carnithine racemase